MAKSNLDKARDIIKKAKETESAVAYVDGLQKKIMDGVYDAYFEMEKQEVDKMVADILKFISDSIAAKKNQNSMPAVSNNDAVEA